ncbi:peroxidase domain-containing protein [Cephalotus follicularis]|uniref:Peroxidase n=1 Tax=Cephalotus follicularis TaxID=3775 RepID=A0A1Q3CVE0_CEPFO|nr:peroxidase domain-containing protein [Cephalotus follicularis]
MMYITLTHHFGVFEKPYICCWYLLKNLAKMVSANIIVVLLLLEVLVTSGFNFVANGLSMNYYAMNCPLAEFVVKNSVNKALQADPTLAAGLVRMHFHDCFIEGCDSSVLIDSTKDNTAEKDSPANLSLRGYEIIDDAKQQLEQQCPGVVSCADIVAMAARDAIFWAGGPVYDIPKGRKDGRMSKIQDTIKLPAPTFNASDLIRIFGQHGFTAREMVALSGAHTLGVARCSSFKSRLSSVSDPNMDSEFAKVLSKTCSGGDNAEQPLDATRNTFDNIYYNALLKKSGVLFSDQTLLSNAITRSVVNGYALNQAMFFFDFQQAMVKMGLLDVKEGSKGEVRLNCRKIN